MLLSVVFAMFHTGVIPVFIDPHVGLKHSINCIKNAKADIILTKPILKCILPLIANQTKVKRSITIPYLKQRAKNRNLTFQYHNHTKKNNVAGIFYTSGSTGVPKGVIWTHKNILAQSHCIQSILGAKENLIALALFPLLLILGPIMGHTLLMPAYDISKPNKISPEFIKNLTDKNAIDYTFGSPIIWKNLVPYCHKNGYKIKNLTTVLCGGAPISNYIVDQMQGLLTQGNFCITYGATEALPVSYYFKNHDLNTIKDHGVLLGKTFDATDIRIKPLETGTINIPNSEYPIGEIQVKGPQVTHGYIERLQQKEITNDQRKTWLGTGDYGYIDKNNNLWYYGRIAHRIENGTNIYWYPVPIEKQIKTILGNYFCTICLINDQLMLILEKKSFATLGKSKKELIQQINRSTKIMGYQFADILVYPRDFPVDKRHHSKLDRIKIRQWASKTT